jgi:1-acyl-sn-glycerol-3-phosphate acyltransferase
MIPGGISELELSSSRSDIIRLCAKHKGFVRLALQNGVPLVPVYSFGETRLLDHIQVPVLTQLFLRTLRIPFPYFVGLGGILQIPRPEKITVVVGTPIEVGKVEDPSEEQVAALHQRFYEEVESLFEAHKHQHQHGDCHLEIIYK